MQTGLLYLSMTLCAAGLAAIFSLYLLQGVARGSRSATFGALAAGLLVAAGLETADLMAVLHPEAASLWLGTGVVLEGAMCPTWLLFTALYAREYESGGVPAMQRLTLGLAALMPLAGGVLAWKGYYYSPDFANEHLLFLEPSAFYFYLGLVLFTVLSLFNLEATLANAAHFRRWRIKFTLLGAIAVLAAMLLYYSQGLLYRSIDMTLAPARAMALLLGVLLLWYSDARRGPDIRISFSRRLAYKSVVLVVAGLYLVGLGVIGEGARHFGDTLGRTMLLALGYAAGLGLLVLSLSETVRRKVKVFLQRNFYKEKYDYRIQWMQLTERLASARSQEDLQQAALSGYCETFGIEGAALFLYDYGSHAYQPASTLEMGARAGSLGEDDPLVVRLRSTGAVVPVGAAGQAAQEGRAAAAAGGDGTAQEAVATGLMAAAATAEGARGTESGDWLGAAGASFAVPLMREESLDGFVLLCRPINKSEPYDEEDFELMETLARHVASALLNMRLAEQLARAREMEVMGKVSTFVLHDLKNHVYTLSLMAENAQKFIAIPEFQKDMVESLGNTVSKMKILISQLKGLPDRQTLRRDRVGLLTLAREATSLLQRERIEYTGEDVEVLADRDEMQKVILNLCLNALEASGDGKRVAVDVGRAEDPYVRVADEGCGIPEEFLKSGLFVPFKTTKAKGMGIGLYQCKQIVEAHGGRIEVESVPQKGSLFTVWLPGEPDAAGAPRGARHPGSSRAD
ncbi:putative phytochrome sensor protein [Desulfovibrio sp. X2]|uniref:ATP-binding protein n=1 Tax=Desulfovibrio sp. X2 TaxID=941449 RepID=UPI00035896E8|nr:ATP-binding protein [Desulfovibrio sp. X2]EPR37223.1 putative phytochrome sensor protein [Desulfovibrio sp. X2]